MMLTRRTIFGLPLAFAVPWQPKPASTFITREQVVKALQKLREYLQTGAANARWSQSTTAKG